MEQQRDEGDVESASKVPQTEKASRVHEVPPIASELETVPIPRRDGRKGKRGEEKRIVDGPAVDGEGKAY